VRDILTAVSPLVVMLSYIISTCDNKQPLVALSASSASLRVCKESGAGNAFNAALCADRIRPWAVRGSNYCKRTIEGQRSAWLAPGSGLAANAPSAQPQLTTPYFQVHSKLAPFYSSLIPPTTTRPPRSLSY
jgi:hypothetical protein